MPSNGGAIWAVVPVKRLAAAKQRLAAALGEARGDFRAQLMQAAVQVLPDPEGELLFTHNVIPFAFNATASVCVAREQCVLTLPSEQPMTAAVSATSMSSQ